MNKSNLFKQAHALTKATIQAGDSYQATFALCLKAVYAQSQKTSIVNTLLAMGLKVWEKAGLKRIYMTCEQFNEVANRAYRLNNSKNKIFYDFKENAILRTYNHKTSVEVQF